MIPFVPAAALIAMLVALGRNQPIPLVSDLLNPQRTAAPPRRVPQIPQVPPARVSEATYLQNGARFFKAALCAPFFDSLYGYALDGTSLTTLGLYRLVPWVPGSARDQYGRPCDPAHASDKVIDAARRGMHAHVNVSAVLGEYAQHERFIVFSTDAGSLPSFAILGPIPVQQQQAPAVIRHVAAPPAAPANVSNAPAAPPDALEVALVAAAAEGLPVDYIRQKLAANEHPEVFEALAAQLAPFPVIAQAFQRRAVALRVKASAEAAAQVAPVDVTPPVEATPGPAPAQRPPTKKQLEAAAKAKAAQNGTAEVIVTTGEPVEEPRA